MTTQIHNQIDLKEKNVNAVSICPGCMKNDTACFEDDVNTNKKVSVDPLVSITYRLCKTCKQDVEKIESFYEYIDEYVDKAQLKINLPPLCSFNVDDDETWFRRNTMRNYRIRPITMNELLDLSVDRVMEERTLVVVMRLGPGILHPIYIPYPSMPFDHTWHNENDDRAFEPLADDMYREEESAYGS